MVVKGMWSEHTHTHSLFVPESEKEKRDDLFASADRLTYT